MKRPAPDYDSVAEQLEAALRRTLPTAVVHRWATVDREMPISGQDVDRWAVRIRGGGTRYARNVSRADLARAGSVEALAAEIRSRAPDSLAGEQAGA